MPITTRSEYGMRAMLLLASGSTGLRMSTTELSDSARIPRKYLEQILRDLKRAGLVRSYAGVRGGYELTRPATEITTGDIIRSLDSMNVMSCVGKDHSTDAACEQLLGCSLRPLWQRLDQAMHEVLDSTTLHQLVQGACGSPQNQESPPASP